MYAIFFNLCEPVVGVPCPSGLTVTGRFYKNSTLKKVKEFYNKKRPSKGWSGVHLLHDNASSHKYEAVKSFLASEKVKVLNHPSYSPDLSPCDFFLFPRLKKMLLSVSPTDTKRRPFICFSRLGQKVTKMCFSKGEYFEGFY